MRVTIRGKTYDSVPEAAKVIGVSTATIYSALHRGTLDTCGYGTGRKPKGSGKGGNPKPFTIGPMSFPDLRTASRALGYEKNTVSNILRRGGEKARAELLRRVMALTAKQENEAMRARKDELRPTNTRQFRLANKTPHP